jgi:hypothetical protein
LSFRSSRRLPPGGTASHALKEVDGKQHQDDHDEYSDDGHSRSSPIGLISLMPDIGLLETRLGLAAWAIGEAAPRPIRERPLSPFPIGHLFAMGFNGASSG